MKAYIIQLQCITNMHVGNGDVNYNIIDNEVERDPVTNYPTINASGVKGALREYFKKRVSCEDVEEIFGADTTGKIKAGKVKVLGAEMVALPARASKGDEPFYLVTTQQALDRINDLAKTFINKDLVEDSDSNIQPEKIGVEGFTPVVRKRVLAKDLYVLKQEEFNMIDLPVLARNKLDNGESKNLWYEEIVPHDSIFMFPVVADDEKALEKFISTIKDQVVQFGGNASIGYGLCKVTVLN